MNKIDEIALRQKVRSILKHHSIGPDGAIEGDLMAAFAELSKDVVHPSWTNLIEYVLQDDLHNRLTPRVVDIAYTAFMLAKQPNSEDGGNSDWFNDTKPSVMEAIAKLRKDLIAETSPANTAEIEQRVAEACAKLSRNWSAVGGNRIADEIDDDKWREYL